MTSQRFRIFHIESPGPLDALDGRAEAPTLAAIAPLLGHKLTSKVVHSRDELAQVCKYLSTIGNYEDKSQSAPVMLHLSAHGASDGDGILLGADFVTWRELLALLQPFIRIRETYNGHHIIVLSSCYAHKQTMTKMLARKHGEAINGAMPPEYIFCTKEILWKDAAIAWTLFYHLLSDASFTKRKSVQRVLNKIATIGISLYYFRWNEKCHKYHRFQGTSLRK